MRLADFLSEVYLPERYDLSRGQADNLSRAVRFLDEWSGTPVRVADLSAKLLCRFLASRRSVWSESSSNDYRAWLLRVWRAAHDAGLAPPVGRIHKLREPTDEPTAWTAEEVSELFWTASHWPGMVGEIPARHFWPALFAAVYWTAERIGAVRQTRRADYDATGWITVRGGAVKTGKGRLYRLPLHATERIDKLLSYRGELLFPWPFHPRHLWTVARRIIERAGLDAPKTGRQLFHRLRRTTISLLWAVDPAAAQRQAGHSSAETTRRHYVSPSVAPQVGAAELLPVPAY